MATDIDADVAQKFSENLSKGLVGQEPLELYKICNNAANVKELMRNCLDMPTDMESLCAEALLNPLMNDQFVALCTQESLKRMGQGAHKNLPQECLFAIYAYTCSAIYPALNKLLRLGGKLDGWEKFCVCFMKGLAMLDPSPKTTFRGIHGASIDIVMGAIKKSEIWTWGAFSSTSETNTLSGFGQYKFIIYGVYGRAISELSRFPNEKEVLFVPGSQLRVLEVKDGICYLQEYLVSDIVTPCGNTACTNKLAPADQVCVKCAWKKPPPPPPLPPPAHPHVHLLGSNSTPAVVLAQTWLECPTLAQLPCAADECAVSMLPSGQLLCATVHKTVFVTDSDLKAWLPMKPWKLKRDVAVSEIYVAAGKTMVFVSSSRAVLCAPLLQDMQQADWHVAVSDCKPALCNGIAAVDDCVYGLDSEGFLQKCIDGRATQIGDRCPLGAVEAAATIALNDCIYVCGGVLEGTARGAIARFSLSDNTWYLSAAQMTPRYNCAAIVHSSRIVVVGGWVDDDQPCAVVQSYDPATEAWHDEPAAPEATAYAHPVVLMYQSLPGQQ
eukprot:TRINITY_DN15814_c0_g1_i1.p1 TRINITY_DN15814_c0_g1~~TRINITY_DN15814_c0_g1_i1.p1  ORF type:complete len:554 (-),score=86.53 TRINITY_DN15814_c0_g1_i1:75-1736(-)